MKSTTRRRRKKGTKGRRALKGQAGSKVRRVRRSPWERGWGGCAVSSTSFGRER